MLKNILKKLLTYRSDAIFIGMLLLVHGLIFLKRVIYPDSAFDSINYHFFLGKNGFDNFPYFFKSNEFYPLGMHSFNPIVDMMGYLFYRFWGYKLGTSLSFFSMIGALILGILIFKEFFREYLEEKKLLVIYALLIIPIFIINEGLFEMATYFTDNLYVFFLMLYLFILLKFINTKNEKFYNYFILILGFIIGLIMTKLTNFIYIVPFSLVTVYFIYRKYLNNKEQVFKRLIMTLVFLILPILLVNYFMFIDFLKSGNPVFPYYNSIFKSVYYPAKSWPFNFGPTTLSQRMFYPFYALKDPKLLGEVKDMFPDIKILVIFFYAMIGYLLLVIKKIKFTRNENVLLSIFFLSFFLWQVLFGYSRYGIFLEMIGGIVTLFLSLKIFINENSGYLLRIFTGLFIIFMVFQSIKIVSFNFNYDVSWRSTPAFLNWKDSFFSKGMFAKYTIINKHISKELKNVDIVLQCVNPSSLYFSTINELKDLPMVNVDKGSNFDMTGNLEYQNRRDQLAANGLNKKILNFAIVFNDSGGPDSGTSRGKCFNAINSENSNGEKIKVMKELNVDNFIGDKSFKLTILIGNYFIDK